MSYMSPQYTEHNNNCLHHLLRPCASYMQQEMLSGDCHRSERHQIPNKCTCEYLDEHCQLLVSPSAILTVHHTKPVLVTRLKSSICPHSGPKANVIRVIYPKQEVHAVHRT